MANILQNTTFPFGSKAHNRLISTRIYGCTEYMCAVKRVIRRGEGYNHHQMPIAKARNLVDFAWFEFLKRRSDKGIKTECDISRSLLNGLACGPLPWLSA